MKKSIYILEDNAGTRNILETLLTEEDYQVVTYKYAAQFWQQLQYKTPDMIVLDIHLPDGNGIEICNTLKSSIATHNIPVIMMSGNNYLHHVKDKKWAEEYINKPFDMNDLILRIEKYLD